MKNNRRLSDFQLKRLRIKGKRKKDLAHLEKFRGHRCIVCGCRTRFHHCFCNRHYHLRSFYGVG